MELLNKLGEDGWELINVVPIERTAGLLLKTETNAFAFILNHPKP